MATNPNVLIDREKFIGSSEISTILGINKFMTRWQLLRLKSGYEENDFQGNIYTKYGDALEPKIRDYINTLGISKTPFVEDTIAIDEPIIGRRCNYDGKSKTHGLEIKTTSQVHENVNDYKYYVVQLLWGMMLGKLKKGVLAVYHRPNDFDETFVSNRLQVFEIDIKDYKEWCEEINKEVEKFKIDLQKVIANPFLSENDLLPTDIMKLALQVDAIEEQLKDYKRIEKEYENIKANLISAMENYNIKSWTTPNDIKITIVDGTPDKEIEIEEYDEDKFISENLELHEQYHNKLAEYRNVRKEIKKGRNSYLKITLSKN